MVFIRFCNPFTFSRDAYIHVSQPGSLLAYQPPVDVTTQSVATVERGSTRLQDFLKEATITHNHEFFMSTVQTNRIIVHTA